MTNPAKFSPHYYLRPRNLPCDGIDSVTGGDIRPFDIKNCNSQQPLLERVYCVFQCFCQCLGLAIVQKYIAHITVKGVDFYLNAYVSEENLFHRVHDIHCKYFSSLYILFSIQQLSQQLTFPSCFFSVSLNGEFFCFFFIHNEIP